MLKLLQEISKKALLLNDFDFNKEQLKTKWLGTNKAEDDEISNIEKKLNVKLPDDYVEFLKISNGFPQTNSVSCSIMPVDKIDYLKILKEDMVEMWCEHEDLNEVGQVLASSILIGGLSEDKLLLLIPPKTLKDNWKYWSFANWDPIEVEYSSFKEYLKSELSFLIDLTKDLKSTKPKSITDYSLRNALFKLDWESVYFLSIDYIVNTKVYCYFNGNDLFALLLVSAGKTNRYYDFINYIETYKLQNSKGGNMPNRINEYLLNKYCQAAQNETLFVPEFQLAKFTERSNPRSLNDIEVQINNVRKDLLKEHNKAAKLDYQLYFLFEFGAAKEFIMLYEQNYHDLFLTSHFKAAIVYSTLSQFSNSKTALLRYFKSAIDYRPFDPFLCESLLPLIDEQFIKEIEH